MVGLGAGARSYTQRLHYSTPWKMVSRNIRSTIDDYTARMNAGDTAVSFGFPLDTNEQQRRYVLQSLLHDGLDLRAFRDLFGVDALAVFAPQWEALADEGCIDSSIACITLTTRGVRHSDSVGQLFFSPRVQQLMAEFEYDS